MSSPELDAALKHIDEWNPDESPGLEKGAFSVFSTKLPEAQACSRADSVPIGVASVAVISAAYNRLERRSSVPTNETSRERRDRPGDNGLHSFDDVLGDPGSSTLTPGTPGMTHNHIYTDNVPLAHTLLSLRRESGQSPSTPAVARDTGQPTTRSQDQDSSLPRHLDALSMPSKQKRLIHHWVTFTSRKLVLLDEPHNPCRTMMLPMALKGLVSKSEDSSADVAVFHAVCASAAYNLYELSGRKDEDSHVLALSHDQRAIHHLRHNLTRAEEHRDQAFAMAIMACIAVEAVSGTTQRWRMHVSGGLAYLANLQVQGLPEAILSPFRQHMVKMAMLCGFPVPKEMKSWLENNDPLAEPLEFTFPYYGVSRSFLRALDHINAFAACNSISPSATPASPVTEKGLDAFELQLYLDFPSLGTAHAHHEILRSPSHSLVIAHTARAFYYAALVYFQRRIRRVCPADVQALVGLGWRELEAVERAAGRQDELGCIMLWPALVLGAECGGESGEQDKVRTWFRGQRRLGFRNVVVLEELVETVWKAREGTGGGVEWWEAVEEARFDIFRL